MEKTVNSKNKFFLCSYTHKVKQYCADEFFKNLNDLKQDAVVHIVDNTNDHSNNDYLGELHRSYPSLNLWHIAIPVEPKESLFQRNVTDSVLFLRDKFLKSDCEYFVIIESDVIPPVDVLDSFERDLNLIDDEKLGVIGGLYYEGFHDYSLTGINKTHHALSGCTLYKRDLIDKYPFRYSEEDLGPFPDAWICFDAGQEYSIYNDHDIVCKHLEIQPGCRQSTPLYENN